MPATVRDYFGTKCPSCRNDILQQAPSTNRMPGAQLAWCPSCDARLSLAELAASVKRGSLLGKIFGRPQRG